MSVVVVTKKPEVHKDQQVIMKVAEIWPEGTVTIDLSTSVRREIHRIVLCNFSECVGVEMFVKSDSLHPRLQFYMGIDDADALARALTAWVAARRKMEEEGK